MNLLSPWNLLWLGLLAPLIALYILKPRRTLKIVSSTWLWSSVLQEMSARHPWQKLKPYRSLILQIAAISLGALALAKPIFTANAISHEHTVYIVDGSLSMQASSTDGHGGHRTVLSEAVDYVKQRTSMLDLNSRSLLIVANPVPMVRLGWTQDSRSICESIQTTSLVGTQPDLRGAIDLAIARFQNVRGKKRIVLLTDAAISAEIDIPRGIPVEIIKLGNNVDNIGIIAADIRELEETTTRVSVFTKIMNASDRNTAIKVVLSTSEHQILVSRPITLRPHITESLVMNAPLILNAQGHPQVYQVALFQENGATFHDDFNFDDSVYLMGPSSSRLSVFFVGDVFPSVVRAIRSDPRVSAFALTKEAYEQSIENSQPLQGLTIFGHDIQANLPRGISLLLNTSLNQNLSWKHDTEVNVSHMVQSDSSDERMRFVETEDLVIERLRPIRGGHALLTTDQGVAIASVDHDQGISTVLGFNPDSNSWARQPSFVLFMHNIVSHAISSHHNLLIESNYLGEPLRIHALAGESIKIKTPSGRTISTTAHSDTVLVNLPVEIGVFIVQVGNETKHIVKNLLNENESNFTKRILVNQSNNQVHLSSTKMTNQFDAVPWLALLILLLLLIDIIWLKRQEAT